jgi:hypothetical protein
MRKLLLLLTIAMMALGIVIGPGSDQAWAHRHFRGHGRVFIGVSPAWGWGPYPYGYYYPGYYYPGAVYAPPPVVVEEPPTYIQGPAPAAPAAPAAGYWYYCQSSRAYYPSVQTCPEAWLQVAPRTE